tara:strand:+ start:317 stop:1129 length:813 start_codon:yes stop_codon:yes gene_type:complete
MTAVQWLAKELESYGDPQYCELEWKVLDLLIEQAKEMEKEQIMNAWATGVISQGNMTAEQYYNETYASKASDEHIETDVEKVTEADYIKLLEKTISTLKSASSQTDREFLSEQNEFDTDNMKDLIIQALNNAFGILEKQIPQTKKKTESISIIDVKPSELLSFMKSNDIPNDAVFSGRDNGYDAWDDIVLYWEIDIPTTDKDKKAFKRKRFTDIAWKVVYDILMKNGYKRVGYNSGLLKQFDDTTVYDMFISKNFDRLVKYYSLPFVKEA